MRPLSFSWLKASPQTSCSSPFDFRFACGSCGDAGMARVDAVAFGSAQALGEAEPVPQPPAPRPGPRSRSRSTGPSKKNGTRVTVALGAQPNEVGLHLAGAPIAASPPPPAGDAGSLGRITVALPPAGAAPAPELPPTERERTLRALTDDAARVALLMRCHWCGWRSPRAVRAFLLRKLPSGLLLCGALGVAALLFARAGIWELGAILGGFTLLSAAAVVSSWRREWHWMGGRVRRVHPHEARARLIDPLKLRESLPGLDAMLGELDVALAVARGDSGRLLRLLDTQHAEAEEDTRPKLERLRAALAELRSARLA